MKLNSVMKSISLVVIAVLLASRSPMLAEGNHRQGGSLATNHPNVLMIVVDDLNDWVGYLGGRPQARTPCLDALAATGTAFTNSHAQAPLCNPSRTSFLSGLRLRWAARFGPGCGRALRDLAADAGGWTGKKI